MTIRSKTELLDAILARAAEQLGDITAPVMGHFYRHHAEARAGFDRLSQGTTAKLEAEMVETVVYCLMIWPERPREIEIILMQTVPHHLHTLDLRADWFDGLIDATDAVIAQTIPAAASSERQFWTTLTGELRAAVADARAP